VDLPAPQSDTDYPGQLEEATSLVASLYGDGESAVLSWRKSCSHALCMCMPEVDTPLLSKSTGTPRHPVPEAPEAMSQARAAPMVVFGVKLPLLLSRSGRKRQTEWSTTGRATRALVSAPTPRRFFKAGIHLLTTPRYDPRTTLQTTHMLLKPRVPVRLPPPTFPQPPQRPPLPILRLQPPLCPPAQRAQGQHRGRTVPSFLQFAGLLNSSQHSAAAACTLTFELLLPSPLSSASFWRCDSHSD